MVLLCFPNPKIGILVREKIIHFNVKNIQLDWTSIDPLSKT